MVVPTTPISLMKKVYRQTIPLVHKELEYWKERASNIPNVELRKQALDSIKHKTFHCEGGGILALLSENYIVEVVRFIVAYQTISDYLDSLCDRSTSLCPEDFRLLHQSMVHALKLDNEEINYYALRIDQDDGGYLCELVETCQEVLKQTHHYELIKDTLQELGGYYCDLQVHKHIVVEEREEKLQNWFLEHKEYVSNMQWYEFSACAGSTLGIFCLVAYAFHEEISIEHVRQLRNGYFPYIQGLHILLDYFIDQEEDLEMGDLNFCTYYTEQEEMVQRFLHFIEEADKQMLGIPHEDFHKLINRGLIGIYLTDKKIQQQKELKRIAKQIIKFGGNTSKFFYWNGLVYRKMSGT